MSPIADRAIHSDMVMFKFDGFEMKQNTKSTNNLFKHVSNLVCLQQIAPCASTRPMRNRIFGGAERRSTVSG